MAQTPRHRGGLTAAVVQTRKEIRRLPRSWHQLQKKNAVQYSKKGDERRTAATSRSPRCKQEERAAYAARVFLL